MKWTSSSCELFWTAQGCSPFLLCWGYMFSMCLHVYWRSFLLHFVDWRLHNGLGTFPTLLCLIINFSVLTLLLSISLNLFGTLLFYVKFCFTYFVHLFLSVSVSASSVWHQPFQTILLLLNLPLLVICQICLTLSDCFYSDWISFILLSANMLSFSIWTHLGPS